MNFGILGSTGILTGSGACLMSSPKTSQVLALLLTPPGHVVSKKRFLQALWGEVPPPSANIMLREHIMKIRKVLGVRNSVATVPGGYRINFDGHTLDASEFEMLRLQAHGHYLEGNLTSAATSLQSGLALWRENEALMDVRDVLELEAEAYRLEELRFEAEELLMECYVRGGRAATAIPSLRFLTVLHPTRERFWALLMAAQSLLGRSPEASVTYHRACQQYLAAIGFGPSQDLGTLHQTILLGEGAESVVRKACPPKSL